VRLLVLGGTEFLGRALVEAALACGEQVTIFTRGRTNPELFPDVDRRTGDRDGDLGALEEGEWDAVVDTSGYVPRVVRASCELLAPRVQRYAFVSSISAYADFAAPLDEDSPLAGLDEPDAEDVEQAYGPLKAACEQVVRDVFGPRALVVRPGLIVGPHDPTGRFTYWVERLARGGDVIAPGPRARGVQFIDVRDLAEWILLMVEEGHGGVFNATGPVPRPTMEDVLEACRRTGGSDARLVWVDADFLLEREVGEWNELPLWLVDPDWRGMLDVDVSRAVGAGLMFRPLDDTARATLAWARTATTTPSRRQGAELPHAGLAPERERELLAAWSSR
jgi:2'-hydroxyisoflavone reductase